MKLTSNRYVITISPDIRKKKKVIIIRNENYSYFKSNLPSTNKLTLIKLTQ